MHTKYQQIRNLLYNSQHTIKVADALTSYVGESMLLREIGDENKLTRFSDCMLICCKRRDRSARVRSLGLLRLQLRFSPRESP